MNYKIFDQMNEAYSIRKEESDQEYMERILQEVIRQPSEEGHSWLGELIRPEFGGCSAAENSCTLIFRPISWQVNPNGNLHGGMISTAFDIAFGMLVRFMIRNSQTVTVELDVHYIRGIPMDHSYRVNASARKTGRRVRFMRAELIDEVTGKLAADASAVFM